MNAPITAPSALAPLSARQRDTLDFIVTSLRARGYPPTLREIGAALEVRSTNGISDHLHALERKGYLDRGDRLSRGMRLTDAALAEYEGSLPIAPAPVVIDAPIPTHRLMAWLVARALDAGVVPFSQMRAALGVDAAEMRDLAAQGRAIDDELRAKATTPATGGTST